MKKIATAALACSTWVFAGCEGVSLLNELEAQRPPPTTGRPPTRDGDRCVPGASGASGACGCPSGTSGTSGACSTGDAGVFVPDGSTTDSGIARPDAGPTADSGIQTDAGSNPSDSGTTPDAGPPCNQHTFTYRDSAAQSVWVSGTFNSWAPTVAAGALVMQKSGTDSWSVTTVIESGGRHEYKFVVDGTRWIVDPANPNRATDTRGNQNSVVTLCQVAQACGDLEEFDWRDSVMYFAMIDRFFDGDSANNQPVPNASGGNARTGPSGQYEGGDLKGLRQKLPYLTDLGVTSLWISAPFDNRNTAGAAIDTSRDSHLYSGFHGYWPSPPNIDYSNLANPTPRPQVESRIGTEQDLRDLIQASHQAMSANGHGVKILFDYVMNHVDIESGLYQAHPDWFARGDNGQFRLCGPENLWNDSYWGERCAFTSYLPPFDMDKPEARAWSVADAVWWAREFGIDGYRMDAIKHVPLSWLTDVRAALNQHITDPAGGRFYLVGETFEYRNRDPIKKYINPNTMLDGQFDFPFKRVACEALFRGDGNLQNLANFMAENDTYYGPGSIMTTWIGNHDIPRAIHFASRQIEDCERGSNPDNGWTSDFNQPGDAAPYERLGLAFAVMMTNPGIPLIYYGDEYGLAGGGDPDNRRLMPWDMGSLNTHQVALKDRIKKLANIRAKNLVLARGQRTTVRADQNVWVYQMGGCGTGSPAITVAINKGDASTSVDIQGGPFKDLMTDANVPGGQVQVPARSFLILK